MSATRRQQPGGGPGDPWWRTGVMWLVIGGPLVVVIAALVTAVIAVQGADDVLDPSELAQAGKHAPAVRARNHAATPTEERR